MIFQLELALDRPAHCGDQHSPHVLRVRVHEENSVQDSVQTLNAGVVKGMPVRMAVAIDTSGSMAGGKLRIAGDACGALLGELRPKDRFSLAAYADRVQPLLFGIAGGAEARNSSEQVVRGLEALGVTRIDLAVDWFEQALPPEPGASRIAILVTDGLATDASGKDLIDTEPILRAASRLADSGVVLCTVGLGDAANFNTPFLVGLSDRGHGSFLFADNPQSLPTQLRGCLERAQSTGAGAASLTLRLLAPGIDLTGCCRIRPDYLPLTLSEGPEVTPEAHQCAGRAGEADVMIDAGQPCDAGQRYHADQSYADQSQDADKSNAKVIRLGGLAADSVTDFLVSFTAPAIRSRSGESLVPIMELSLAADDGKAGVASRVELKYTASYADARRLDEDVNRDRLQWEMNLCADALSRCSSVEKTADLLSEVAFAARKAGRNDLSVKATGQLADLQKTGRIDANRATGFLVDARKARKTGAERE